MKTCSLEEAVGQSRVHTNLFKQMVLLRRLSGKMLVVLCPWQGVCCGRACQ